MIKRLPGWLMATLVAALTFLLGVADWQTGYQLNFFVFYFLPLSIAAWRFGVSGAIAVSSLCTLVWAGADLLSRSGSPSDPHAFWNATVRLVAFLTLGVSVARIKALMNREREALSKSRSEVKMLETLLPICAQCKKIRDDHGAWQTVEAYFTQHSATRFSHGYCPQCAERAMKDADLTEGEAKQVMGAAHGKGVDTT